MKKNRMCYDLALFFLQRSYARVTRVSDFLVAPGLYIYIFSVNHLYCTGVHFGCTETEYQMVTNCKNLGCTENIYIFIYIFGRE